MSAFPGSPRLLKGAIVAVNPTAPLPTVVAFQYNPNGVQRSLQPQLAGGLAGADALRFSGAPVETITLNVEIDAADQLEQGAGLATSLGIYPQLAALEILVYPSSATVIANTALLALGTIEVIPPMAPLTLLIWGPRRVVPVTISDLAIAEEAFDVQLNPIRATVTLNLRVLSYNDLPVTHPGYHLFLAHQVVKEAMAAAGSTSSVGSIIGGDVRLPL